MAVPVALLRSPFCALNPWLGIAISRTYIAARKRSAAGEYRDTCCIAKSAPPKPPLERPPFAGSQDRTHRNVDALNTLSKHFRQDANLVVCTEQFWSGDVVCISLKLRGRQSKRPTVPFFGARELGRRFR